MVELKHIVNLVSTLHTWILTLNLARLGTLCRWLLAGLGRRRLTGLGRRTLATFVAFAFGRWCLACLAL